MSEAFKQQWLRTSASKRLLVMLTSLAKQNGDMTFQLDDLESIDTGDGIRQRFVGNSLVISYRDPHKVADEAEQTFVIDESRAAQRSNEWQDETETPSRLRDLLEPTQRPINRTVTTTDDAEMAARETQGSTTSRVQRAAAQRRGVPLPTPPTPPHPIVS